MQDFYEWLRHFNERIGSRPLEADPLELSPEEQAAIRHQPSPQQIDAVRQLFNDLNLDLKNRKLAAKVFGLYLTGNYDGLHQFLMSHSQSRGQQKPLPESPWTRPRQHKVSYHSDYPNLGTTKAPISGTLASKLSSARNRTVSKTPTVTMQNRVSEPYKAPKSDRLNYTTKCPICHDVVPELELDDYNGMCERCALRNQFNQHFVPNHDYLPPSYNGVRMAPGRDESQLKKQQQDNPWAKFKTIYPNQHVAALKTNQV